MLQAFCLKIESTWLQENVLQLQYVFMYSANSKNQTVAQ